VLSVFRRIHWLRCRWPDRLFGLKGSVVSKPDSSAASGRACGRLLNLLHPALVWLGESTTGAIGQVAVLGGRCVDAVILIVF
jgi:hypothetical protein